MGDAGATVIRAARDGKVSWPVARAALRGVATAVVDVRLPPVSVLGADG